MFKHLFQGVMLRPRTALFLAAPHTWPPCSVLPSVFSVFMALYMGITVDVVTAAELVLICILMQSSVNVFNDFFDFINGTDSKDDFVEPDDSVLITYGTAPIYALIFAFALLGAAGLMGLHIVWRVGFAPLIVGIVGAFTVLAYSAGPLPLSRLPLGELFSGFVMGGLIPLGCIASLTGEIRLSTLFWAIPFIIGIALIMLVNNTSDIEKDMSAGRKTLPVLIGREKAVRLYRALIIAWFLSALALALLCFGYAGFALLLCICFLKKLCLVFHAPLVPQLRVTAMKGILSANLIINGTYFLSLILAIMEK